MRNYIFILLTVLIHVGCSKENLTETKLNVSKKISLTDLKSPSGIVIANDTTELKNIVINVLGDTSSFTVDRVKYLDAGKGLAALIYLSNNNGQQKNIFLSKNINVYKEDSSGNFKINTKAYKKIANDETSSSQASSFYCQGAICCNAEVTIVVGADDSINFIVNCGCNSFCIISQGPFLNLGL